MFRPLSCSRFGCQNACLSHVFNIYSRADLVLRCRIRCNSSATAAGASTVTESNRGDSPTQNYSSAVNAKKPKKIRLSAEDEAQGKPLSLNKKTLAALKAALEAEDQETKVISAQAGQRKDIVEETTKFLVGNGNDKSDIDKDTLKDPVTQNPKASEPRRRKRKGGKKPVRRVSSSSESSATRKVEGSIVENSNIVRRVTSALKSSASSTVEDNNVENNNAENNKATPENGSSTKIKRSSIPVAKASRMVKKGLSQTHSPNRRSPVRHFLSKDRPSTREVPISQSSAKADKASKVYRLLSTIEQTGGEKLIDLQALADLVRNGKGDKRSIMGHLRKWLIHRFSKKSGSGSLNVKKDNHVKDPVKPMKEKLGMTAYEIKTIEAAVLELVPLERSQPPVPTLAYGLERVLFNPGVYHLRDPRSRVFNFDPYLQSIMPVADFDFNALKEYITSSRDETLISTAAAEGKKYTGSTSSMTSALAHFHFLLSQWRPVNISNLSQGFPEKLRSFTNLQRTPSAVFLRWKNGTYAIDADKEFDSANILMMLGKSMEKLLTLPTDDFEKYRKENSDQISEDQRNEAEAYHYTTMGDFLMRSQLDAYDPRIPGTGMFDLKTRAVVSIRMDAQNYHGGLGYEIRNRHGKFESYEREYYDMIRAAFLKYSLQVRMGRMDGIFVAFHNTERIFGFQYISLPEMDFALHGQDDVIIGDSEFKLSLELLNRVLDRATARFPEQSLRIFFETREAETPFMYVFAEPVTEEEIQQIQESQKAEIEEYERTVLGLPQARSPQEIKDQQEKAEWEELQAKVEETMDNDELGIVDNNDSLEENTIALADGHRSMSPQGASQNADEKRVDELLFALSSDAGQDEEDAEIEENVENYLKAEEADEDEAGDFSVGEDADGDGHGEGEQIEKDVLEVQDQDEGMTDPAMMETSKEDVLEDSPTESAFEDTQEHSDMPEDGYEVVQDETTEKARESQAEDLNLNGQNQHGGGTPRGKQKSLLAMTLTIRNKVNGFYVERPENLGPNDKWSVEYALAEVPKQDRSRSLYEKTQRRRERVLKKAKDDSTTNFSRSYAEKLRQLSQKGRKWRQEQNEIDQAEPIKVLGDPAIGAEKGGVSQ